MQVTIEDVPLIEIGNKGVLIRVRNNQGANVGKLRIGQATIKWARGRTPESNAKTLSVEQFVEFLNNLP